MAGTLLGAVLIAAAPTAAQAAVPLSQGKTATASSTEAAAFPASAAVDGDLNSRWASAWSDPQWLQVDLGATATINQVVLRWEAAAGKSFEIQTSPNGSTWTSIYSTTTGAGGTQTLNVTGSGRYVRMYGTARTGGYGYSLYEFEVYGTAGGGGGGTTLPTSDTPDFGSSTHIFDPSMSSASIQSTLDEVFNAQKANQFGSRRDAVLFKPGSYSNTANVGYYTSVAGLGASPDDVTINGDVTVDAFNASDAGNATQNFWRSTENLSVVPSSGTDRWAVAQAGPFRRMHIKGGLNLFPASYGWASGGYIADSKIDGKVSSASQQQWYSRDSNYGSWDGSVWNMVFSGVTGAPATTFPNPPITTLATTPQSREKPFLYFTGGKYRVFVPSLRTNASGASWTSGTTAGSSIPMSQFYVVKPGDDAARINQALAQGLNLFFTPGVYHLNQTLNVTRADTVVLGIGLATLIPDNGVTAINVSDVDGVKLAGLLIDAGSTNSNTLVTVGQTGASASHAANPTSLQDVFFRIGGASVGKATTSLLVNSDNVLLDHIWAWRADHGSGIGWTTNTADTGVTVNGDNVLATGLFVEHYQKTEVNWTGNGGKTIFFQNEMPYDVPDQASWMNGSTKGYAAYRVAPTVTSHEAWGMGSYCYFNVNGTVAADHAFEVPTSGTKLHDLLTVSLGNNGSILHVVNNTGAVTPTNSTPSNVTTYP